MIIACSAKTIQLINEALFERVGKDAERPVVVTDKDKQALAQAFLDENPECYGSMWNLDIEESPVHGKDDKQIGVHRYGYLINRDLGTCIVLNGLDCVDLCHIGSVAQSGIETILTDFVIPPRAIEVYFKTIDTIKKTLLREKLEHSLIDSRGYSSTVLIRNGDRSAARVLSKVKESAHFRLYKNRNNYISPEPIERYLSFCLNKDIIKVRKNTRNTEEYVTPFTHTRKQLLAECMNMRAAAVRVRIQLYDSYEKKAFEPACTREVLVPLEASLGWVHQMIQKTFNWADYHLHRFDFLDKNASRILEDAFRDIFEIASWEKDDYVNTFQGKNGEKLFINHTRLSLRWLYGDYSSALKDEGAANEDFPLARLPESMPLGLALLGSDSYINVLQQLTDAKIVVPAGELPCNALNYNYDYGDGWELSITATEFINSEVSMLPKIVGAQGHTPPEDCGGLGGYSRFLKAIDPTIEYADEDGDDIDLLSWAKGNGWKPFESLEDLQCQFDRPFTWSH